MVYNRLRIQILIRLLAILIFAGFLVWWVPRTSLRAAPVFAVGLLAAQIFALFRAIEKPQRELVRFFQAIEYSDFTQSFSVSHQDKSLQPLRAAFDRVMQAFQKSRAEKEAQFRYFQTVIQHVGIGIVVFARDGRVDLVNQRAKKMFGIARLEKVGQLSRLNPDFPGTLSRLASGDRAQVRIRDSATGEDATLSLHATRFVLQNESMTLVSIQNIQSELEEKELEAWQNLIRVLTHEITNSVTPIASLASTAGRLLQKLENGAGEQAGWTESVGDVKQAVRTIESRSEGLLKFVAAYRRLTRIPKPDFTIVPIRGLLEHVASLLAPQFREKGIRFTSWVEPETLEITADASLIEQVLINLLQNAVDWAGKKPGGEIALQALIGDSGRPVIQASDNGPGIEKEALDKIFIPFFTTKEDGSGIGLSLSRQIMRLHHGSISAASEPGRSTVFTLRF
jgi:nitrogen fixation/metabolism regulation signal transduction histidine kinase